MSEKLRLVIVADPDTGRVAIDGPINNMIMVHWMLGEARRLVEARANEHDRVHANGGIVKPEMVLHLPKA